MMQIVTPAQRQLAAAAAAKPPQQSLLIAVNPLRGVPLAVLGLGSKMELHLGRCRRLRLSCSGTLYITKQESTYLQEAMITNRRL